MPDQRIKTDNPDVRRALLEKHLRALHSGATERQIRRATGEAASCMSYGQRRIWFLNEMAPEAAQYNIPGPVWIDGTLNLIALSQSLVEIVRRHENVRSTFTGTTEGPRRELAPGNGIVLQVVDATILPDDDARELASELSAKEAIYPFNLVCGPLIRATLIGIGQSRHLLLLTLHHIVADAWSHGILVRELAHFYQRFTAGQPSELPEHEAQYVDYTAWQHEWLEGPSAARQIAYWRNQLADTSALRLPTSQPRPAIFNSAGAVCEREIDALVSVSLREFARRENVTLYMVTLAAYAVLLYRYTEQNDIAVGSPIANRSRAEVQHLIGFFLNTLVMRIQVSAHITFRDLLKQVKEVCLEAYSNQDLPFDRIVEELNPIRDLATTPLFQVGFTLQHAQKESLRLGSITIKQAELKVSTAKHDWTMEVFDSESVLRARLEYRTDLFNESSIEQALEHYATILQCVAANPDAPIGLVDMLSPIERQDMIETWNLTERPERCQEYVHRRFEDVAASCPDAVAICTDDSAITFGELNRKANRLAWLLRRRGFGREKLAGIAAEPVPATILCQLAVLKAGGAYVPLDPAHPKERHCAIAAETQLAFILTPSSSADWSHLGEERLIRIDRIHEELEHESAATLPETVFPESLAYVIYTSGSTGKPKGVMLHHSGLANFVASQVEELRVDRDSRSLWFASASVDASVTDIFPALVSGATLCVATKEELLGGHQMLDALQRFQITHMVLPPSLLALLEPSSEYALRTVVSAGEACTEKIVETWSSRVQLVNGYGPTETTVGPLLFHVPPGGQPNWASVPIGKPVSNMQAYILNTCGELTSTNVAGEIMIGGIGVARGYFRRSDLTAERFIPNPFGNKDGQRLYRTGDMGKRRPDGNIEYIGRTDYQVKIRGNRIEPEEIEAVLRKHPAVQKACVVVTGNASHARLSAFVSGGGKRMLELWPSFSDYSIYVPQLHQELAQDEWRNDIYRQAIGRFVRNKVVLDARAGTDVVLARFCNEAGARKVYAIEPFEPSFRRARDLVRMLDLDKKISVLHGDVTTVNLPERVDVCVLELVGAIGEAGGAGVIQNAILTRHLKPGGVVIPCRSITLVAAVSLPENFLSAPAFSPRAVTYVSKIFEQFGAPFDLRLCIQGVRREDLVSEAGVFEDLDFTGFAKTESEHRSRLKITRRARIDGLLVWLTLDAGESATLDTLDHKHSRLPVYLPVFPVPVETEPDDVLDLVITRTVCPNGVNTDFRVDAILERQGRACGVAMFRSLHSRGENDANAFYDRLHQGSEENAAGASELRAELHQLVADNLPAFMCPSRIVIVPDLPLLPSGKVDRRHMECMDDGMDRPAQRRTPPSNETEKLVAGAWETVLKRQAIGVDENFFEAGGNSLLLASLSQRLTSTLGNPISILELYRFPTISSFVKNVCQHMDTGGEVTPNHRRSVKRQVSASLAETRRSIRRSGTSPT